MLPKLHLDADYPCDLVGNWNTWYGEQDQAGERVLHEDRTRKGGPRGSPVTPLLAQTPTLGRERTQGEPWCPGGGSVGFLLPFPPPHTSPLPSQCTSGAFRGGTRP